MHETTRAVRPAATLLALLILLTSCARLAAPTDGGPSDAAEAGADENLRPVPSDRPLHTAPPSGETVVGEVPVEILDSILAAAADRTGVAANEIDVVQAEQVTWPDGSLGCPQPDQMYTQALVDGYQVVLDAGGEELDYRVGSGGSFRLCEGGLPREGG